MTPYANLPSLTPLFEAVKRGDSIVMEELWDAPKALIAAEALRLTKKNILILTGASHDETTLYHDIPFFTNAPVIDFPAWETLPSERVPPSPDIVGERYEVLEKIIEESEPKILLSSLQAVLQKLILPEHFASLHLTLKVGEEKPFSELIERLQKMGYERRPVASDKGEFAVRGGIVDLFPVSSPDPFRIEFFGDQIESIRIYDPIGQKSIKKIERFSISPAKEMELLEKTPSLSTLLDYLGKDTLIILDNLTALEDRYATLKGFGSSLYFSTIEELLDQLAPLQTIYFPKERLESFSTPQKEGRFTRFELFQRTLKGERISSPFLLPEELLFEGDISDEALLQATNDPAFKDYNWNIIAQTESELSAWKTRVSKPLTLGYLSEGFAIPRDKLILFPLTEITHRYKIRRQKHRSTYHTPATETFELHPGDMVVHLNHGIGKFLGMEKRPDSSGLETEFFVLEYAKGSKLFVPMKDAYLLTKYIGATDELPSLHEIGSTRWKRAKERTQAAILGYAKELLELYAKRSTFERTPYPEDSDDLLTFEEEFPFEETQDQLSAIAFIKKDMSEKKIMDRLVCGDVGYGKTEVAMRAAFKAVVDGKKQVAVLVPTTVLAMQHYENFKERMQDFPINIGVLSRFVSQKEIKATLEGATKGSIDIVIGTHRLISEDVTFKDLGLVIIDEEQRFGVKAKEHLKKAKVGVDCLTLSATPIPRTLYLSLMGAREISIINTPPQDRIPIKTVLTEPSDDLIKSAVMRELARDGQVFYIHNRIESIFEVATRIKRLVPDARVIVGHGQMSSSEIDSVFHAFKKGEANVLVATTIVENGIDIPNANTILIDNADRFGLAELYQLRGRVGRWNRRAYAYFLVPKLSTLPEISKKRLSALAGSSGYGGGMKVALRDLEIRGAGNILGEDQSGQVETIGFHQYCKWLKRAVATLKGESQATLTETKIDIPIDARLPESYVNEVTLRMEFYQRLGEALTEEEVDAITTELLDRFGPLPQPALWLVALSKVRAFAQSNGFKSLTLQKHSLHLEKTKGANCISRQLLFKAPADPTAWQKGLIELMKEMP